MTLKQIERIIEKYLLQLKKKRQWEKNIASRINKNILTKQQCREVKQCFGKYIKLNNMDAHSYYTSTTGFYSPWYIPDWIYYAYIDSYYNDWEYAIKLDNKCFYDIMFPDCKHLETIAYRINGIWLSSDRSIISFENVCNLIKEESIFVKSAVVTNGGHGVKKLVSPNIDEKFLGAIQNIKSDIVVQRSLIQSLTLSSINESSVNTIRVLSVLTKEKVKIYSAILRMGVNGSYVDNASSGGITIGINKDGTLKSFAYDKFGKRYERHPSSGIVFSNIKIPNYDKVLSLVEKQHPMIPHFRMVSWDIALDINDQPVLIEANLKDGELDFHQYNNGPLFGEDTEKILEEVFL